MASLAWLYHTIGIFKRASTFRLRLYEPPEQMFDIPQKITLKKKAHLTGICNKKLKLTIIVGLCNRHAIF